MLGVEALWAEAAFLWNSSQCGESAIKIQPVCVEGLPGVWVPILMPCCLPTLHTGKSWNCTWLRLQLSRYPRLAQCLRLEGGVWSLPELCEGQG